jgi:hypothetical protein
MFLHPFPDQNCLLMNIPNIFEFCPNVITNIFGQTQHANHPATIATNSPTLGMWLVSSSQASAELSFCSIDSWNEPEINTYWTVFLGR